MPHKFLCQYCGKEFTTNKKDKKYCNLKCYHLSRRKRVIAYCKYCGKEMKLIPKYAKKKKYCSYACNNKSRRTRPELPKRKCQKCGKIFKPHHSYGLKYCSLDCYWEDIHITALSNQIQECPTCQREFTPRRHQVYCSRSCAKEASKKQKEYTCKQCGKIFVDKAALNRQFCSRKCQGAFNSIHRIGKNSPTWQGGTTGYRGGNWHKQANKARKRDNYTCQVCGHYQKSPALPVHHIIPYREFNGDWNTANKLSNLITLCRKHHKRVEWGVIPCPTPKH